MDPTALMPVGLAIARLGATIWLKDPTIARDSSLDLSAMFEKKFAHPFSRNRARREFERIAEDVAERLEPYFNTEFRGLDAAEAQSAAFALSRTLERASVGRELLLGVDLDATRLEQEVRSTDPTAAADALLEPAAVQLYNVALRESCNYIVELAVSLPAFTGPALAEVLARETELASLVREALENLPKRRDGQDGIDDGFEQEYARAVARKYDRLELFGFDAPDVPRRFALSVAYITLSTSTIGEASATGGLVLDTKKNDGQQLDDDAGRVSPVDAALSSGKRILIRGEAGYGKTTLLQWLAVSSARESFRGELSGWNGTVPLFLRLRSYAKSPLPRPEEIPVEAASALAGTMPPGWVHENLRRGKGLVLVDGLDELPESRRGEVKDWLEDLTDSFPDARYIVTSRPGAAEEGWLADLEFATTDLQPMSGGDIDSFIGHWHVAAAAGVADESEGQRMLALGEELQRLIRGQASLQALATTPLLCAMLCALHKARRSQLPRDRVDLYRIALEMLLERRDRERSIPDEAGVNVNRREKELLLQTLAYSLAVNGSSDAERSDVVNQLSNQLDSMPHVNASGEVVFQYLMVRSGLLREPVPDRVDFIHRTFQEYLAARQALDQDHVEFLVAQAHLDQWRETVVLAAGLAQASQRERLLDGIIKRGDLEPARRHTLHLLAAACLETSAQLSPELAGELSDRLADLVPPSSMTEARALASAGDLAAPLLARQPGWRASQAASAARALALIGTETALGVLRGYGSDPRVTVSRELIRGWESFDADRYASEVLASSCLDNGRLVIERPDLLEPAQRWLQQMAELTCVIRDTGTGWGGLARVSIPLCLELRGWLEPDLRSLGQLPGLREISAVGSALCDISDLGASPDVQGIDLSGSEIRDIAVLEGFGQLLHANFDSTMIERLPALPGLRRLDCSWCDDLVDISMIGHSSELEVLDLQGSRSVADLSALRFTEKLQHIWIDGCVGVVDISSLSALESLRMVSLGGSAVAGLPPMASVDRVYAAHCSGLSRIADFATSAAARRVRRLNLNGCVAIEDAEALGACDRLMVLDLAGVPLGSGQFLARLQRLEDLSLRAASGDFDLSVVANLARLRVLHIDEASRDLDLSPLGSLGEQFEVLWMHDADPEISFAGLAGLGSGSQIVVSGGNVSSNLRAIESVFEDRDDRPMIVARGLRRGFGGRARHRISTR